MLCLGRREGQEIVLETSDGVIRVVVHHFSRGRTIHIGVDAPAGVAINRREIYERKRREQARRSTGSTPADSGEQST